MTLFWETHNYHLFFWLKLTRMAIRIVGYAPMSINFEISNLKDAYVERCIIGAISITFSQENILLLGIWTIPSWGIPSDLKCEPYYSPRILLKTEEVSRYFNK